MLRTFGMTPGMVRIGLALLLPACAGRARTGSSTPPQPCEHQAEIDRHERERVRLSDAMHDARAERERLQRELDASETQEQRQALAEEIRYQEGAEAVYFSGADEHYFAAQDLEEACACEGE